MSRFFSGFFFWLHFYSELRHRSRKEEEFSSFEIFFHFCFLNNDEVFPHSFYDNESIYASVFWQTEKYFSVERRFSICLMLLFLVVLQLCNANLQKQITVSWRRQRSQITTRKYKSHDHCACRPLLIQIVSMEGRSQFANYRTQISKYWTRTTLPTYLEKLRKI